LHCCGAKAILLHLMSSPPSPSSDAPAQQGVFAIRDYRFFWSMRFFSTLGVMIEAVTLGWQVYDLARKAHNSIAQSAFLVGMVGLVQFAPLFALTLVAGAVADHFDRRKIYMSCMAAELICVAGLIYVSIQPDPSLLAIFIIAGLFGAIRAFIGPAGSAMGPMLVPRELLPRAVAMNSMAWQTGAVIGPWIGGTLCGISPVAAYGATALLYSLTMLSVLMIRGDTQPKRQEGSRLAMVREGLVYVWENKIVLGAISLDLVAVLLGGATALLPVYARDILHVGAHGFGILRSGPAIGACACAFWLGQNPLKKKAGLWMFGAVALFGLATIVFALSTSLVLSVAALAVLGGADMISVFVRQTLVQITTPDAMRGRVAAVSNVFVGASNELGEFESGIVARLLGPVGAALFGGIGSLIATAVWARLFPTLRKADQLSLDVGKAD
jgi:MFS family permease